MQQNPTYFLSTRLILGVGSVIQCHMSIRSRVAWCEEGRQSMRDTHGDPTENLLSTQHSTHQRTWALVLKAGVTHS